MFYTIYSFLENLEGVDILTTYEISQSFNYVDDAYLVHQALLSTFFLEANLCRLSLI
jgi:hypothetical protein